MDSAIFLFRIYNIVIRSHQTLWNHFQPSIIHKLKESSIRRISSRFSEKSSVAIQTSRRDPTLWTWCAFYSTHYDYHF